MSDLKTFSVEIKVHFLDVQAIDIDEIVAKHEVESMLQRTSIKGMNLVSGGQVINIEEVEE